MTTHSWLCPQCGAPLTPQTSVLHYCPNFPRTVGAKPVPQITEADVRRIIREELRAMLGNQ